MAGLLIRTRQGMAPLASVACILLAATRATGLEAPRPGGEQLGYHTIRVDADGQLLPWLAVEPGRAYDQALRSVWGFWRDLPACPNGVKYSLQHQVWSSPVEDARGLGGNQLAFALASWSRLYAYLGERAIVDEMRSIADHCLAHGLSTSDAAWPNLPFPYNTELHSGVYDGDMRAGKGFLQPDKAGAFGYELVVLHEMTGEERYLEQAVAIADTLARKVTPGDGDHSPWPFKVHAVTGEVGSAYTSNWTGTLRLFDELVRLGRGETASYAAARGIVVTWLRAHPVKTNKWGPFFEDIVGWSDTEINADTLATYILEHPDWSPDWLREARGILDWSQAALGNAKWARYGVTAMNEQTAYPVPGNSHTSRHASAEMVYSARSGDASGRAAAVRQLSWATYMVGNFGNNLYAYDDVWLTDGYGDYVQHYLRAMAAAPELAPSGESHLLGSSSAIQEVRYGGDAISYRTFGRGSSEVLRLAFEPGAVTAGGRALQRYSALSDLERHEGYVFSAPGDAQGVLRVRHDQAADVTIARRAPDAPVALDQDLAVDPSAPSPVALLVRCGVSSCPSDGWSFEVGGPFHGRVAGVPPRLTYTPDTGYAGFDMLTFTAKRGGVSIGTGRVRLCVGRTNLARLPGTNAFSTENAETGERTQSPLPALVDGDVSTSVVASARDPRSREVGVGVLWLAPTAFRQVVLGNGRVTEAGQGRFAGHVRLQLTPDGSHWEDAACPMTPPVHPVGADVSLQDFAFTCPSAVEGRGVRVVGDVGGGSSFLSVRELAVYASLGSLPQRRKGDEWIDVRQPLDQVLAEGDIAQFSFRFEGPQPMAYQWQQSADGGASWTDVPGANSSFLAIPGVRVAEHDGLRFRCQLRSGGFEPRTSDTATLSVTPAGAGHRHTSGTPLR